MTPYADMYEDWTQPCPQEEHATEEWIEYMRTRDDKEK